MTFNKRYVPAYKKTIKFNSMPGRRIPSLARYGFAVDEFSRAQVFVVHAGRIVNTSKSIFFLSKLKETTLYIVLRRRVSAPEIVLDQSLSVEIRRGIRSQISHRQRRRAFTKQRAILYANHT